MAKLSKQQFTLLIIVLGGVIVLGLNWFKGVSGLSVESVSSRAKGRTNAPIQIIEYIDFQCPACAKGALFLKNCYQKYPDKFYISMKNYPLGMHQHAFVSSLYAQCAAKQNKFWPFHDAVISRQDQWKNLPNAAPEFQKIAEGAQMDLKELEVCLQDQTVKEDILKEKEVGTAMGVQSTPTYFVNKKMVVGFKNLETELANIFKQSQYGEFSCSY